MATPVAVPLEVPLEVGTGRQGTCRAGATTAGGWGALPLDLLLQILLRLETLERRGAHLTCRTLRDAARLSLAHLGPRTLDPGALRAAFPNVTSLHLRGLTLSPRDMLRLGGLGGQLTALRLCCCTLGAGPAGQPSASCTSALALAQLHNLANLELEDVKGPCLQALDDALRDLSSLTHLRVSAGAWGWPPVLPLAVGRGPSQKSACKLQGLAAAWATPLAPPLPPSCCRCSSPALPNHP